MAQHLKTITLRTTIIYAILAGLWILISDWTIYLWVDEPTTLTQLQTYKGLLYVVITTLLLYVLLRTQLRHWAKSVTAMEQTRQALSASNDYLKAVLDATSDTILVIDPKSGIIVDANQRVYEMYGYALDELIGKPMTKLSNIAEDYTLNKVFRWAARVRREGPQVMEWKTQHKNGYLFWAEIGLRYESIGEKERFVMSVRDINHRKKIEDNLKESQRMLDTLVSNLPGMVYRCQNNPEWTMTYVSQGVFALTGYRPEDLIGENNISFTQLVHPEDRQRDWEEIQKAIKMQRSYTLTYRLIDISNIEKWVWEQGRGVFDENEQLLFLEGFIIDITEKKKTEELLRISDQTYQGILSSITEAVYIQDEDGKFLHVNLAAEKMEGFSYDEIAGQTPKLMTAPGKNDLEAINIAVTKAYQGEPQQFEYWGMRKTGEIFPQEVNLTQGWYFGKRVVIAVARDITSRKNAEQALYKRFSELEALRTIDRAITSSFERQITLDILLKQTIHQLEIDAAAILVLDEDFQTLKYIAAQGFRTNDLASVEIRPGQGLAGEIMLNRQLVKISDRDLIENDKPFAKPEEFSNYYGLPLIARGQLKGILEIFHREKLSEDADWIKFLETLANQTAIAIDNAQMFESLQHKNLELALAYDATIEGWSRALELREGESPGHSERISQLTIQLAQTLGLQKNELANLRHGVLLHDIGKMGIPDKILLKKGKLTKAEREIMQEHPSHACKLLSNIGYLKNALDIPLYHHEKWDGTGYPDGLGGIQIPLAARIFAVVDVWDALTSDRPHRKAWSREKAFAYLREQRGKHFDPEILDVFLKMIASEEDG
jgi:PAS domain S-box-containing protein